MGTFRNDLAIVAAHGLTERVAATWAPDLPRTPRVMVPVQLDALVLRQDGGTWADTRMKEPPLEGGAVPRLSLLPDPFTNMDGTRKRGVHLHWALPDGLTHGTTPDPLTQATFPQIPDRWVILRMFPAQDGTPRRGVRGWVLRSGEDQPVVVDLDQWREPGPKQGSKGPLTAMGHGDPAWAAYYDNVVNRLGFYDDLRDIQSGPIAYLVCGWYADPKQDPLGTNIHSLTDFDAKMAQLGWELATGELEESHSKFSDYVKSATMLGLTALETVQTRSASLSRLPQTSIATPPQVVGSSPASLDPSGHPESGSYQTNGAWWPSQIVCHGSVVGIGWPGIGFPGSEDGLLSGEIGGPPPVDDIKVAYGNTLTEALSALVAHTNNNPREGRVLEAFMLGAMQEFDQPDGISRVDARLHANTFGSLPGGEVEETITIPGSGAGPRIPANPVTPKPGIFKRTGTAGLSLTHDLPFTLSTIAGTRREFVSTELRSEATITTGRLSAAIEAVSPFVLPEETGPQQVQVKRSLPRRFYPSDPVFLLQGCDRSFKHGGDGRFSEDGKLICRLTGFASTEIACFSVDGGPLGRPAIKGDDLLLRGVENGSIPPECEDLLRETVLHDPGTAVHAAQTSTGLRGERLLAQAQNFMVEQTVWWATRDPRVDHAPLVTKSGITGMLPSAIAVSPPVHPWTPLHLDWKVQFIPSPRGIEDWTLGEIDFHPNDEALPPANDTTSGIILSGRALLTGGVTTHVASSIRNALKQAAGAAGSEPLKPDQVHQFHSSLSQVLLQTYSGFAISQAGPGVNGGVPAIDRSALEDITGTLEHMDVLGGALDNFHERLHDSGVQVRAGFLRILRLRLVDCFGQFLDLAGSGDETIVTPRQLIEVEPISVTSRPDIAALPPRFISPSRLWFRLMDADTGSTEAKPDVAPVCGFILPNHLDGDMEFFDAAGVNLGVVRPEPGAGVIWEDAPGLPSTLGASPARAIPNGFLAGVAQGLLDWGVADATAAREDALSALLRIIDSTLWSVDPFGHTGDEHLALLIGHPIAVLRARVRLEVEEPLHPELLAALQFPLRLGALTHWQDGLLGYFVNDDYQTLYCADGAVAGFAREVGPGRGFLQPVNLVDNYYQNFANDLGVGVTEGTSPVNHPYVDDSGILHIRPNQEINLTLLVEPHAVVHATTGYLPRKEIGMRREWIAQGLAAISPTLRFGPVLVDPKRLRMPVPNDLHGTWSWDHRLDITTWAEDKVINTKGDAMMSDDAAKGQEGWLRLTPQAEGN
jgi:hypothetical protein